MDSKLYILHCSENASEVFLINLERYFNDELIYIDETQTKSFIPDGEKVIIIITDQFLKNKKCLDLLNRPDAQNWDVFTIIYYHSGLNRVDKSFDVKSHGKIDLYYYRNFWERRYIHERKWIIDLGKDKKEDQDQYLFDLKHLKNNFGQIVGHLNANPNAVLEQLKESDYAILRQWLENDDSIEKTELTGSNDIISRVPGINVHPEESEQATKKESNKEENRSIESELLRKLVEFKKNQLGDSNIADEYIKEQLAKSQQELENEYQKHTGQLDLDDIDDLESTQQLDLEQSTTNEEFSDDSPIIIEDDSDDIEDPDLSDRDKLELESLIEQQLQQEKESNPNEESSTKEEKVDTPATEMAKDRIYYELALFHYHKGSYVEARHYYNLAKNINPRLSNDRNERAFRNEGPLHYDNIHAYNSQTNKSTLSLQNYILITGGTSGIGKATAEKLASNGHNIIITGRRKKRLKKLSEEWSKKYGVEVETLKFDIRDFKDTRKAVSKIEEKGLLIDVLINNAGLASGLSKIQDGDIEDWNKMIDTNIKGLLHATRCIIPLMIKRGKGHIINIGSIAGKEVYPSGNVYNASKFAVEALTKAMRLDLSGHNIRVSQVSPGHVEETEFAEVRFHGDKERAQIYQDFNPLTSPDVADIIYFILTRSEHVNIQDVLVMGTQQASANLIDRSGRKFD